MSSLNDEGPRLHLEEEKKKLTARKRENEDEKEDEKTRELCRCEDGGDSMAVGLC